MLSYLSILRPFNCLMSVIAVIIGSFLLIKTANFSTLLAVITAFLVAGAGNVINDYVDIDADKINRPKRPIPSGKIKPKMALAYCIALFVIGISISFFINMPAFLLASVNSFLLIIYSTHLKRKIFIGNIVISYMVGSTILFGSLAVMDISNPSQLILPLLLMALSSLSNFSREIVKTVEDLEGDKLAFIKKAVEKVKGKVLERFGVEGKNVKFKYSEKFMIGLASFVLLCVVAISPLPFVLKILGLSYLIVLIPTDFVFFLSVYILISSKNKKRFSKASKLIKVGMFLGLAAYIVGIIL